MRLSRVIVKVVGVFNILFGLIGIYLVADGVGRSWRHTVAATSERAYSPSGYYVPLIINLLFVSLLLASGILLLRARRKGVVLSNTVFLGEIGYWAFVLVVPLVLIGGESTKSLSQPIGSVAANMGIAPQVLVGYPLLGLVFLNLAHRKLSRDGYWGSSS